MAQNRKMIADRLTGILKDTRSEYANLQERDRVEQARAGAESIQTRGFAFKEIAAEADALVGRAADKALGIIDSEIEAAGGALVEAPSAEAVAYVSTIAARSNLSADEVAAGLSRYRDHASQKAIKAAAVRSGLQQFGGTTAAEDYISDLRSLRDDVAKTYTAGFGGISEGYAAVLAGGYQAFADNPGSGGDALAAFAGMENLGE